MATCQRVGVYDLSSARTLLCSTVERLDPDYDGPYDTQALIQYLEALVLRARSRRPEPCGAKR
jgi:hypothetical protein